MHQRKVVSDNEWTGWLRRMRSCFEEGKIREYWESGLELEKWFDPIVRTSGNSVYVTWRDKKTGNWDIMFARSTDGGKTFEKIVNLSNSPDELSEKVAMTQDGKNLYFAWWQSSKNGTIGPVFRTSDENGVTFGPVLRLSANGPVGG